MEKTLEYFRPTHDFLVCIDSDGCVYDVMEVKHKECFCPATVNFWNLQAVDRYAREAWEFVNLYSVHRGVNRFLALVMVLELLAKRREVQETNGFSMPEYQMLKAWTESGEALNHNSLERHQISPELRNTLEWSLDCNRRIREMVRGVPPFAGVRESLIRLTDIADIVIVSATSTEALLREWEEHGLLSLVSAVCGQEAGSKTECIRKLRVSYQLSNCLMIGDAPGDMTAAKQNGVSFYPICPMKETNSWKEFSSEILGTFLAGGYQGKKEEDAIKHFMTVLPQTPPWEQ